MAYDPGIISTFISNILNKIGYEVSVSLETYLVRLMMAHTVVTCDRSLYTSL